MKALLFNGSPRKGNTYTALKALKRGLVNINELELWEVDAYEASVAPCVACDACASSGKCICDDDTNEIIDAVAEADLIVFATPVYWWGVTAQMKLIIDKLYAQCNKMKTLNKQVGIIIVGEAEQDDPQYDIIPKQFECICDYLGWQLKFCNTYTACAAGDLAADAEAIEEIEELWESVV